MSLLHLQLISFTQATFPVLSGHIWLLCWTAQAWTADSSLSPRHQLSLSNVREFMEMLLIFHKYWWLLPFGLFQQVSFREGKRKSTKVFWAPTVWTRTHIISLSPTTDLWGKEMILILQKRKSRFMQVKGLPRSHSEWRQGWEGTQA